MVAFLEERVGDEISYRCPHMLCRKWHKASIAADDAHAVFQQAGYVVKCDEFEVIVGTYDRAQNKFVSVIAVDPPQNQPVRGGRQRALRGQSICELQLPGCTNRGTQSCHQLACKKCCNRTNARCFPHRARAQAAPAIARPAPDNQPENRRLLLNLSVTGRPKVHTAEIMIPGRIFHLALLEREQFNALSFKDIDTDSLQFYDLPELNWKALTLHTAVHLDANTGILLLRANARLKTFPPQYVCEFSDAYDEYCGYIASDVPVEVAFKKAFPQFQYCAADFNAALDIWSAASNDVQTVFKETGRTDAGLWVEFVKDAERRERLETVKRRRSVVPAPRSVKNEIIIIDD